MRRSRRTEKKYCRRREYVSRGGDPVDKATAWNENSRGESGGEGGEGGWRGGDGRIGFLLVVVCFGPG